MTATRKPAKSDGTHDRTTPVMEQYIEIKTANPDSLLFYRMGDFYELFFSDAETASRALGITLTKRGKHLGQDIPMCGVPVHAAEEYLHKLIGLGHRVAVCEQMEEPANARKRGSRAVVRRDVVRLVTPGTITEENLLDPGSANHLAALARVREGEDAERLALAWTDISTGAFGVMSSDRDRLIADLARIEPSELICATTVAEDGEFAALLSQIDCALSTQPSNLFDSGLAGERFKHFYGADADAELFGLDRAEQAAAGAIIAYVEKTQIGHKPVLAIPTKQSNAKHMVIDAATRTNLELVRTLSGEQRGSLFAAIDRTVSAPGRRMLRERMLNPLADAAQITKRQDAVQWFSDETRTGEELRALIKQVPDMARALSRLSLERSGPRDLLAIRIALDKAGEIQRLFSTAAGLPAELVAGLAALAAAPGALHEHLVTALDDDVPIFSRDGGFVRPGYDRELDDLRLLRDESRKVIASLQATYVELTGVKSLKIRHNNVLGYFVEVTAQNAEAVKKVGDGATFIHRQTMANAMRFVTTELADLEQRIINAAGRAVEIELAVFQKLATEAVAASNALAAIADALAVFDVAAGLAIMAKENDYHRPLVDDSLAFAVIDGRHPSVEAIMRADGANDFVPNNCDLSDQETAHKGKILLMTGPNMGGKSTFLRQNALIAILAQMGAFVPARSAHIGVVDQLFSRVGAADDLARGRSTFMVEMVETATILNGAGTRALVILDEIGRGTATFDGLSIAWAALEHLHEVNRCRTLFATHYHELTVLAKPLSRLVNFTMRVKEWKGDVMFLHEVAPGVADRSYGVQVAKLAGLPEAVVARARDVLDQLEETARASPTATLVDDLPLFAAAHSAQPTRAADHPALDRLQTIEPDELTPREALQLLYELKKHARAP